MSQFEYVTVAVSLVLAFGVTRLLGGLPLIIRGAHPYWVHSLWSIQALVNFALFWWVFWNFREVAPWTLGKFLLILLYPAACFVSACVLVPSDASETTDWHGYYFESRRLLFSIFAVSTATFVSIIIAFDDKISLVSQEAGVGAAYVALYAVAAVSANPKVHGAIVVTNAAMIAAAYAPLAWGAA